MHIHTFVNMRLTVENIEAWNQVANVILAQKKHKIICLKGELGAGKTTLIQAIAKQLKIKDPVTSPTYSLIHEYGQNSDVITHMDLYRLTDTHALLDIGIEEYLDSYKWVFIEWPQILLQSFQNLPHMFIDIEVLENGVRVVNIEEVD